MSLHKDIWAHVSELSLLHVLPGARAYTPPADGAAGYACCFPVADASLEAIQLDTNKPGNGYRYASVNRLLDVTLAGPLTWYALMALSKFQQFQ